VTAAIGVLRDGSRSLAAIGLCGAAVLTIAYVASEPAQLRTAVAVGLVLLAAAVGLAWPERLIYGLVVWLVVLGLVRRVLSLVAPSTGSDPLLLVEAVAVMIVLAAAVRTELSGRRSALQTSVAAIAVIILASTFNPAQGSPTVGAAGLLFLLLPLAGFWIGRSLCTDVVFARILKLTAVLAVAVAAYGLTQTFAGFPRWDAQWLLTVEDSYRSLNVGAVVRPFASLPSSAEYAYVVAVGLAIWLAFGLRVLRLPFTALAVALLGTALVLASVRLVIFLAAAALIAMLGGRLRVRAPVAAVAVLLSFFGTSVVVGRLTPDYYATGATGSLLAHQLEGLSNPLDPESSTFFIHASLVTDGLHSALSHPAGLGAGSVTLAANRFGGVGRQSEADPSNLAIAAGLPGLVTYFVLATIAFVRAYGLARERRDALSLSALAIVTIVFLHWFNGGQYGIALLLWLTLGWIDRAWILRESAGRSAPAAARSAS
jgi:hypothetical protein